MLPTTLDVIRAGLKSDPTITPANRNHLLTLLRTGLDSPKADSVMSSEPRLIRRAKAAHILDRSLRFVDRLAKDGILVKRRMPGRKRAAGFLEADVLALIK